MKKEKTIQIANLIPAGSEIDASIIYADYYYLEALLRLKALQQHL